MKKYIFLIAFMALMAVNPALCQWNFNGNAIYNSNTGNVGIGIGSSFTPTEKLHINNFTVGPANFLLECSYSGTAERQIGFFRIQNSANGECFNFSFRKLGTAHEMIQSCRDAGGIWREFIYFNTSTRKYEMRSGVQVAEFLNSGNLLFNNGGSVGVGTSDPQSSAAVDITSTSKGFLPPRMTNAQMNAIQNPVDGLLIYCTDCASNGAGRIALYFSGSWHTLSVNDCSNMPSAPTAGTPSASAYQIVWNWNAVTGATGYKWNTTNDYGTAIDMGTATSYTETGLACNASFTRHIWAYNACGVSSSLVLTQSTVACFVCGTDLTIFHVADNVAPVTKTVVYSTVTGVPGAESACWLTSNLGSDHQATSVNDATESSAGWYWQFNHMQGYKHDGTTRTPGGTWNNNIDEYSNWTIANDPCAIELGTGWRLPTSTEWTQVDDEGTWTNWNGPWNSLLKMHAAGSLDFSSSALSLRGTKGFYWSSSQSANTYMGQELNFSYNACALNMYQKSYGFSVRCLKE